MKNSPVKILYIANNLDFLISHRLPLIREATHRNWGVHVAGPGQCQERTADTLSELNAKVHTVAFNRENKGPLHEFKSIYDLYKIIKQVSPDVLHLVTIRANIYGGLVARFTKVPNIVFAISGLGHTFISKGLKAKLRLALIKKLYKFALNHKSSKVIFQNADDAELFTKNGLVNPNQIAMVKGSGVDIKDYEYTPEPPPPIRVLFASRLIKEKGIEDYITAVKTLKPQNQKVSFEVAGDIDIGNPSSLTQLEIAQLKAQNIVTFLGHCDTMNDLLSKIHMFVLPSYREGLPKVLLEAAAAGRAIVTTDVPGCREVVVDGLNGLLVPVRDPESLSKAIQSLISNDQLRSSLGQKGRQRVEENFTTNKIVELTFKIYEQLGIKSSDPFSPLA